MVRLLLWALSALALAFSTLAYSDYDNDFLDPKYILSKDFNLSTAAAQQTIVEWADFLAAQGPWCTRITRFSRACIDSIHSQLSQIKPFSPLQTIPMIT